MLSLPSLHSLSQWQLRVQCDPLLSVSLLLAARTNAAEWTGVDGALGTANERIGSDRIGWLRVYALE